METALTVIACDRPHEGVLLRASDGTFLEVFTWKSEGFSKSAESNAAVQRVWSGMAACADFVRLNDLEEASRHFAHFHRQPAPGA